MFPNSTALYTGTVAARKINVNQFGKIKLAKREFTFFRRCLGFFTRLEGASRRIVRALGAFRMA